MSDIKQKATLEDLLTFPCEYGIKVIGLHSMELQPAIMDTFAKLSILVIENKIKVQPSSNQNYLSITIYFHANNAEQIRSVYQSLKDHPLVKMCL